MAFDEARGRVVLGGGMPPGSSTPIADTWEWTGSNWVVANPPVQLNWNRQIRLVYAPQRSQVLAVSGDNAYGGSQMTIHAWTGTQWQLVDSNGPISRANAFEVAWDAQRGVLVMFGSPFLPETWEWNGFVWQQRSSGGPTTRSGHRIVYDEARQRVVLYGGISSSKLLDDRHLGLERQLLA